MHVEADEAIHMFSQRYSLSATPQGSVHVNGNQMKLPFTQRPISGLINFTEPGNFRFSASVLKQGLKSIQQSPPPQRASYGRCRSRREHLIVKTSDCLLITSLITATQSSHKTAGIAQTPLN